MLGFHAKEFNTCRSLAYDTSLIIEQEWVFCYNHEECHLVYKVACVSHVIGIRYIAFHGQWEVGTKIDGEAILGESNDNWQVQQNTL